MLDVRDSTFKMNYYLDEMYTYDNDPYAYVAMNQYETDLKCVYITPNLLDKFEIVGEKDFYVLFKKVQHQAINLGFHVDFFREYNFQYVKSVNF